MATSYNKSYFLNMLPEGLDNATQFGPVPYFSEVILHDPHYFTMNKNPLAIPKRGIPRLDALREGLKKVGFSTFGPDPPP